jgi:hypothetical protein
LIARDTEEDKMLGRQRNYRNALILSALLAAALMVAWSISHAQTTAADHSQSSPVTSLTEVQALKIGKLHAELVVADRDLAMAKKDAEIAELRQAVAQFVFDARVEASQAEAQRVRDTNGWPPEVTFDPYKGTFTFPKEFKVTRHQ